MELLKAIILGAVQGITEFLPVSSTGHLILFEKLLGVSQETYGLTFDAALHLGTLIAVILFFKNDWLALGTSALHIATHRTIKTTEQRLVVLLIVGTIPAILLGLLFEEKIETAFRSPLLVAVTLILFSFVLLYVEKVGRKYKSTEKLTRLDSLIIGTAQSIALVPGVSRSGITIASGMWRGLKREEAARFAFLLSAPIIAGAGGLKLIKLFSNGLGGQELVFFLVGMISATIFGYLTIKYFIKFVAQHSLLPFIVYRILLGGIVLAVSIFS